MPFYFGGSAITVCTREIQAKSENARLREDKFKKRFRKFFAVRKLYVAPTNGACGPSLLLAALPHGMEQFR
jgi:hypothetical protein